MKINKTAREEKRKQNKYSIESINIKLGKFQGLFFHEGKGELGPA